MSRKREPRFPDYNWYCANCKHCLNDQSGFDDNKFIWKCTNCGHKNSISKDNLKRPYAYLKDPTPIHTVVHIVLSFIRTVYGFISRTALYCFIDALIVVFGLKITTFEKLSWGLISAYEFDDYFQSALYFSGPLVAITLVIFALSKIIFGTPDLKKYFLRETLYFLRDNLLYPIKLIQSLFSGTSILDKLRTLLAIVIFSATIGILVYGSINWL